MRKFRACNELTGPPMKMGIRGPQFGGSLFSYDTWYVRWTVLMGGAGRSGDRLRMVSKVRFVYMWTVWMGGAGLRKLGGLSSRVCLLNR